VPQARDRRERAFQPLFYEGGALVNNKAGEGRTPEPDVEKLSHLYY
jgi:hypothetical protein